MVFFGHGVGVDSVLEIHWREIQCPHMQSTTLKICLLSFTVTYVPTLSEYLIELHFIYACSEQQYKRTIQPSTYIHFVWDVPGLA